MTTTAEIHYYTVALNILANTHLFFPITECTFLVNKGVKHICNQVRQSYEDECIIPLNKFEFYFLLFLCFSFRLLPFFPFLFYLYLNRSDNQSFVFFIQFSVFFRCPTKFVKAIVETHSVTIAFFN